MTRDELEHIIRAAAAITGEREFVIIGAAAILGSHPFPPPALLQTIEADIFPLRRPELAELLNDIGELSSFHDHFHVYAHGVGPETAVLPAGWQNRFVTIQNHNTNQAIGCCLDPHDLAASKLVAGREKDLAFIETMLRHAFIDAATLRQRIAALPVPAETQHRFMAWLARATDAASP